MTNHKWANLSMVLSILLLMLLSGCGNDIASPTVSNLSGELPLQVPQSIKAGEAVNIVVGPIAAAQSNTPVKLIVVGSYGTRVYQGMFEGDQAQFFLPGTDNRHSGYVTLTAVSGEAKGESGLTIQAGEMVEPIVPLVGARSITADAGHWSMVVSVPSDAYGNPAPDDTEVRLRVLHPDNRLEEKSMRINHLVAWQRIYSGTKAGRTTITTSIGTAHGPESELLEVAGWPTSFSLSNDPITLPADGRRLMKIRSGLIRDKFDNVVPDGTLVTFIVKERGEVRRTLPSYTLGGVTEISLQAPEQPGTLEVYGVVYGVESQHLQITFTAGPAVNVFALNVVKDPTNRLIRFETGPLLGTLSQFIPDGTPVLFRLSDSAGQIQLLSTNAIGGRATLEIRLANLLPGAYSLEAIVGSGRGTAVFNLP